VRQDKSSRLFLLNTCLSVIDRFSIQLHYVFLLPDDFIYKPLIEWDFGATLKKTYSS